MGVDCQKPVVCQYMYDLKHAPASHSGMIYFREINTVA